MSKYKITSITYKREMSSAYGKSHLFHIKVENDDRTIQYFCKTNPCDLKEEDEVEGDISTETKGNYTNHILKISKPKFSGGGGANPEVTKKVAALNNVVALIVSGKVELNKLESAFDEMMKLLNKP